MPSGYQGAASSRNTDPDSGNMHLYRCQYGGVIRKGRKCRNRSVPFLRSFNVRRGEGERCRKTLFHKKRSLPQPRMKTSMFRRIFDWGENLKSLSFINRAIMQVSNLSLTFAFVIFGYASLFHTGELLETALGHSLLVLISLFWLLRAIEQVVFFKLKRLGVSNISDGIFVGGGALWHPVSKCHITTAPSSMRLLRGSIDHGGIYPQASCLCACKSKPQRQKIYRL